jgi:hypothetical protein
MTQAECDARRLTAISCAIAWDGCFVDTLARNLHRYVDRSVPVEEPRPEPDAIDAAARETAEAIDCHTGIEGRLRALADAILAEVDRRIAAALAPAELGISIEDICGQLSELARAEANDANATLAYRNHASHMAAVFNHSALSIRKGRINA